AIVHTARALCVTLSMVWLPATVVMPSSSQRGSPAARRIARASSWPGSQSRMIFSVMDRVCPFAPGRGSPQERHAPHREDEEAAEQDQREKGALQLARGTVLLLVRYRITGLEV